MNDLMAEGGEDKECGGDGDFFLQSRRQYA